MLLFSWFIVKCNCIVNLIFVRTSWFTPSLFLFPLILFFSLNIFFFFCFVIRNTSLRVTNLWQYCLFEHIMQRVLNFTFYFLRLLKMYGDYLVDDIAIKTLLFIVKLMIKTLGKIIKHIPIEVLHLLMLKMAHWMNNKY